VRRLRVQADRRAEIGSGVRRRLGWRMCGSLQVREAAPSCRWVRGEDGSVVGLRAWTNMGAGKGGCAMLPRRDRSTRADGGQVERGGDCISVHNDIDTVFTTYLQRTRNYIAFYWHASTPLFSPPNSLAALEPLSRSSSGHVGCHLRPRHAGAGGWACSSRVAIELKGGSSRWTSECGGLARRLTQRRLIGARQIILRK
jgi:hypothetical protein